MANEFDADLDALGMSAEGSQPSTPAPAPSTPAPALKFGGREFKTADDLGKSYDALVRDYTQKAQKLSALREWEEYASYLKQNPKLAQQLADATLAYQKGTRSQPVAPEVASTEHLKQIEELQSTVQSMEVDREIERLKAKHNVDDATVQRVCRKSYDLGGIPLEEAFHALKGADLLAEAATRSKAEADARERAAKAADVGGSTAPMITPSRKDVSRMSEGDLRSTASKMLDAFGFKGE